MHIAVTGGVGQIGSATVAYLMEHGHMVRVLDRVDGSEIPPETRKEIQGADYRQVDITDFESLEGQFDGLDAVVHLAALASPNQGSEHVIFDINGRGSFNVYRAAADAGIRRVVSASSINALGYHYGIKPFPIEYLPIDEAHPEFTTDPYSFSKRVLEETAEYFWRREGVSGVSLRFPAVYRPGPEHAGWWREGLKRRREAFETLEAMSPGERESRVCALIERHNALRAERVQELPWEEQRRRYEKLRGEGPPPPEAMLCWGRTDFWASLHVLDAAQAIEKGVIADYEGSHVLFVNDSHNSVGVPSRKLAAYCFPEVRLWKHPLVGTETLVSIDRARALIVFEPEHSIARWFSDGGAVDLE